MDGSSRKRVKTEQDIQDSDADLQAQTMPVLARSDDGDLSAALRFCHAELQEEGVSFPSSFGRMLSAAAAMVKSKAANEKQKAQLSKLCCPGLSIAMDKVLNSDVLAAWNEDVMHVFSNHWLVSGNWGRQSCRSCRVPTLRRWMQSVC